MAVQKDIDPETLQRPEWNSLLNNYSKHDIGEAYFQGRVEQIGLQVEHWGIDKRHHDDGLIFDNKMDLRLWEPRDGQDKPDLWPSNVPALDDIKEPECPTEWFRYDSDDEYTSYRHTSGDVQWTLRAVADVKTKSNSDWLGKFNLRHLAHYAEWAHKYDVPVFVYMTMVDPDAEQVGQEDFLTPIVADWNWELLCDHYDDEVDTSLSYGELKDTARGCPIVERTFRAPDGNLVVETADEYKHNWDYFVGDVL